MRSNRLPVIRISPVHNNPNQFVASYRSDFLGATFAVVCSQTITGSVALHHFARMLSTQYGRQVDLQIDTDLFPVHSKAVEDILHSIRVPELINQ